MLKSNLLFFSRPKKIVGYNLIFKTATKKDASFILELRTDIKKSRYISKISNDLKKQEAWLEKCESDSEQVYFIILDKEHNKIGTVRLYDQKKESFCWGSWILKDRIPNSYAIESALIVYHFALYLGFKKAHFNVSKDNKSVWRFHESFGAERVDENAEEFIYNISSEAIKKSFERYKKFLPNGCLIEM